MGHNAKVTRMVVMGVAGCGKSTLAHAIAEHFGWTMIEGDEFHSSLSQDKMRAGLALTDQDRHAWLHTLAGKLNDTPKSTVLACSALKRAYRDILRAPVMTRHDSKPVGPDCVLFVYMALTEAQSYRRVAQRPAHSFPASLVHSQFETLESPEGESSVLTVDGMAGTQSQLRSVELWLSAAP